MKTSMAVNPEPMASAIAALAIPRYDLPSLPATLSAKEFEQLARLETEFDGLQKSFERAAEIILEIRDKQLYRQKYKTFEEYCRVRWNMGARRGRQLADGAMVLKNLEGLSASQDNGTMVPLPKNERQVRPLAALPAEAQREVWAEVATKAVEENREVTGREVQRAVEQRKQPAFKLEAEAVPEEKSEWPQPNKHGVYDDAGAEVVKFSHALATVEVRVLQVGEYEWVASRSWKYECGNQAACMEGLKAEPIYGSRELALREVLMLVRDENLKKTNYSDHPNQKRLAETIVKWCGTTLKNLPMGSRVELHPQNAPAPENKPGFDAETVKVAKRVYQIAATSARIERNWNAQTEASQAFVCAIVVWHMTEVERLKAESDRAYEQLQQKYAALTRKRADESDYLDRIELSAKQKPTKGAKVIQQEEAEGTEEKGSGFVFCREPMPGSISQKPRYGTGGGWTNDPRKAKVFFSLEVAKRENRLKDKIMPLEKAVRRFNNRVR